MRKLLILSLLISALATIPSGNVWAADTSQAKKPEPHVSRLPDASAVGHVLAGSKIFETICVHCHRLDLQTSLVGAPGLRDVTSRHDIQWIEKWITNPQDFAKVDPTAKALVASNPYGLVMPTLPEMQDAQNRADIIAFLKTLTVKKEN